METIKRNKTKKIVGVAVNVVIWIFVIFAACVTAVAVSAIANKNSVPTIGKNCFLSVQSDSMNADKPEWVGLDKPSGFKKGDLLIGEYVENGLTVALEKGDVITFKYDINGDGDWSRGEYNTHRIVDVVYKTDGSGEVDYYLAQGDNIAYSQGISEEVRASEIIAVYKGKKIGGIGGVITWLGSKLGFLLCVVTPLALFFIYELVVFIRAVAKVKNDGKKMITAADEEIIKQRAIEEYLRAKEEEEKKKNEPNGESEIRSDSIEE